jgi:hypothetical protein
MAALRNLELIGAFALLAGCGPAGPARSPQEAPSPEAPAPPEPAPAPRVSHPVESNGSGSGCTAAVDAWIAESGGESQNPSKEYDEELQKALNRGTYLNQCSVPASTDVQICAAVLDGTVRGVTISLDPAEQSQADCVAAAVERMEFTSQHIMSLTRTRFEPSR